MRLLHKTRRNLFASNTPQSSVLNHRQTTHSTVAIDIMQQPKISPAKRSIT